MDDPEKEVRFLAASWTPDAKRDLATIGDMTAPELKVFEAEIIAGRWQILDVVIGGKRRGCVVHSVEQEGERHSLVINAAAVAPVRGVDVTASMMPLYLQLARHCGAYAIRCWTRRVGLVRKLERVGATRRYVMELEL